VQAQLPCRAGVFTARFHPVRARSAVRYHRAGVEDLGQPVAAGPRGVMFSTSSPSRCSGANRKPR